MSGWEDLGRVDRKQPVWERFAAVRGGRFWITRTADHIRLIFHLAIPAGGSEIAFLETDTKPLKLSYAIQRDDGFRFSLWPQDFTDAVAHFFGAQDIEIGDAAFDKAYVVKATGEHRIRRLLEPPGVRAFLLDSRVPFLGIDELEGAPRLHMTANHTTETEEELDALFVFFRDVVERLGVRGAAGLSSCG